MTDEQARTIGTAPDPEPRGPLARPLRLALLLSGGYVALCSAYIVVSSRRAAQLAESIGELRHYEEFKGLGFVAVTGLVFFAFAWTVLHRLARREAALLQQRAVLASVEGKVLAGAFAATVAHDINNVLAIAASGLDALQKTTDPERAARASGMLGQALEKLTRLSQRLLALGRGSGPPVLARLDLARVVGDAVDFSRRHPRVMRCRLATGLAGPLEIQGDEPALQRLVINLVLNAAEAAGESGRIEVRLARDGAEARLEVHDDGPGVPEERRAGIFEAFHTTKPDGNGLGLFSVARVAELHGGRAEALASELGGACFRVSLPAAEG
jgi:two-component system sensor histidine kinase HydH